MASQTEPTFNYKRKADELTNAFLSASDPRQIASSGRTLKRYRSNRPPESLVHERTLQLLFSAQNPALAPTKPAVQKQQQIRLQPYCQQRMPQQKTLYAMFGMPSPSRPSPAFEPPVHEVHSCEDCDRRFEGEDSECVQCMRTVCNEGCSFSTDAGKVCLECTADGMECDVFSSSK